MLHIFAGFSVPIYRCRGYICMDECLEGILISTGIENSAEFKNVGTEIIPAAEDILKREKTLRIRDCRVLELSQRLWLNFEHDIDGIVATFGSFKDILTSFSYLGILPRGRSSILPVYNIVRKHFKLHKFKSVALQYLQWSVSTKITQGDGFDFHLALLPRTGDRTFKQYRKSQIENLQFLFYEQFRRNVSYVFQNINSDELSRPTFKKIRILDVRRLHILPNDREFILHLLDEALAITEHNENFESMIIAFKLGDHDTSPTVRIDAFNVSSAVVTVHSAITVSSLILNQHIFWSRFGIQDIVGKRGSLLTALSLSSCCNYQSNLDRNHLDISGELRQICNRPGDLNFVQFYADTPHLHMNSIHPIFGSVVSCGILHGQVLRSLERKSKEYLSLCKENLLKLSRINARVEIVCIGESSSNEFKASDYINLEILRGLIAKYPLLVPFADGFNYERYKFIDILRSIPEHIHDTLSKLFDKYNGRGGFFPVWQTYQYEVANELFWKGRPNAYIDNTYAINLGPGGSEPSRCITWERGFMCLEDSMICALNDRSTPPLIFTKLSEIDKNRISRIFTFVDVINGSHNVVGKRAALILLQDIQADPSRIAKCDRSFISDLKINEVPFWGRMTGVITLEHLCLKLCKQNLYRKPYVFGRVLQLITEQGLNACDILCAGFKQLGIQYFPDIRCIDSSRNQRINWPGVGVLKIVNTCKTNSNDDLAVELSREIIWFLEKNGLVYKSKFVPFLEESESFSFPWLYDILEKLSGTSWNINDNISVLSYVTCIGLLQNHWYVDLKTFTSLHFKVNSKYPNMKRSFQSNEVLSVFMLPAVKHLNLSRMHESLPIAFPEYLIRKSDMEEKTSAESDSECETMEVDNENTIQETIAKVNRKHLTAGLKGKWSSSEIEILDFVLSLGLKSEKDAYNEYLKYCDQRCVPDRSYNSFKSKYHRIKSKI